MTSELALCGGCMPADATVLAARRNRQRHVYRFVKRLSDIALSLLALVVLSPLMLLVAAAIRLETPGPVIFVQIRVGEGGRRFRLYKFRSMYVDADEHLADVWDLNERDGPAFKAAVDPRTTHVGRVIRRLCIDELPQLVNVIRGDMSIVGPRPALPREVASYTARQRQRLLVRQGLTCYWQARPDRDALTFDEWMELDRLYVRSCGIWTDIRIIVRTMGIVLRARGS